MAHATSFLKRSRAAPPISGPFTGRVKNRFNRLKVYKRSAEGKQLFRGRQGERDPITKGYVLEDASLLWQGPAPKGRFVIENVTGQR